MIEAFHCKIHQVRVSGPDFNYVGSITMNQQLAQAMQWAEGQKVGVEHTVIEVRFDAFNTYGKSGYKGVALNVPVSGIMQKDEESIVLCYPLMSPKAVKYFKPVVLFPDEKTNMLE